MLASTVDTHSLFFFRRVSFRRKKKEDKAAKDAAKEDKGKDKSEKKAAKEEVRTSVNCHGGSMAFFANFWGSLVDIFVAGYNFIFN